jgi:hypothetical protein
VTTGHEACEAFIDPNESALKAKGEGDAGEETSVHTRMVMALVKQDDGCLLAVWVHGQWTLPGALMLPTETQEQALSRGLRQCVGTTLGASTKIYEGPNTTVYAATVTTEGGRGMLPWSWLSEEQFLSETPRRALFEKVLAAVATQELAKSSVISKLKDGRILYAVQYEIQRLLPGEREPEWLLQKAHHVHAMDAEAARTQFLQGIGPSDPPTRIVAVAPAIGFFEDQKTGDLIG